MELNGTILTLIFWLVAFVALLVIEGFTMQMVCIWFAIGALGGLITATMQVNLYVQFIVFLVTSVVLLVATRPFAKKIRGKKRVESNLDRIIQKEGIVTEEIDNLNGVGQVKVRGQIWTARSINGEKIEKGAEVKVDQVDGAKIMVSRYEVSVEANT